MDKEWDLPLSDEDLSRGTEWVARRLQEAEMFVPPLQGSLLAGRVICFVPYSDVKYKDFLEWWFAVGRKAPDLTVEGWRVKVAPHVTEGRTEIIPEEDWNRLPENEREAICKWANKISVAVRLCGGDGSLGHWVW